MIVFLLIGTITHSGCFGTKVDNVNLAFETKQECALHLKLYKIEQYNNFGPDATIDVKCVQSKI